MNPSRPPAAPACGFRDESDRDMLGHARCRQSAGGLWPSPFFCGACCSRRDPEADWRRDRMLARLLLARFARPAKIDAAAAEPEAGILTAADRGAFSGLQLLVLSLALSHRIPMTIFDLGLEPEQRDWLQAQQWIDVRPAPSNLPMPRTEFMWQSWARPALLLASPYPKTLWLDTDTVVLRGDLRQPLAAIDAGLFLVRDACPASIALNQPALYEMLPPVRVRMDSVFPNAGVLGIRRGRDDALLHEWLACVRAAAAWPEVRAAVSWWDQGALHWALERSGRIGEVRPDMTWNTFLYPFPSDSLAHLLDRIEARTEAILHFAGRPKPWASWNRDSERIDLAASVAARLRVFVLGHGGIPWHTRLRRPYLQHVDLDALALGRFQDNRLSESRAFLDPGIAEPGSEYVGLASARWDEKYQPPAWPDRIQLRELDLIEPCLEPGTVLAADPVASDWLEQSEASHPGIAPLVRELAELGGVPPGGRPAFWSNNFICHRDVWADFLPWWRSVFHRMHDRYGLDLPYDAGSYPASRAAGYLYERLTMLYFSARTDLKIMPMTYPALWGRWLSLPRSALAERPG